MNHFFALELPENIRRRLAQLSTQWQEIIPPSIETRWYAPEDYHITLKFLGNIDPSEHAGLIQAAAPIAAHATPIPVTVTAKPGAFPNRRLPRILWAGVVLDRSLASLAAEIDAAMAGRGLTPEKRAFLPHITLARCRPGQEKTLLPVPPQSTGEGNQPFLADHFTLMQTLPQETRRNRPKLRYNTVHTFPFGNQHS